MSGEPIFRLEGIDVFYGTSQILFRVGFEVVKGQTMALLGRNGAGKSTTMKAIMGLAPARRGKVTLRGHVVGMLLCLGRAVTGLRQPGQAMRRAVAVHERDQLGRLRRTAA